MMKLLILTLVQIINILGESYYDILGVTKQATTQEIRQAYKQLAVKFHPDKTADEERFIQIKQAYETLKDADLRYKYDMYGTKPSYVDENDSLPKTDYDTLYYKGHYHEDLYVINLSELNYNSYLREGLHFIIFYSPFCPPCQRVAPNWKKFAELYNGVVKIAAVNCKLYNYFCYTTMRIGSYPSLLFYSNGRHDTYDYYRGDRTVEGLDQFMLRYLNNLLKIPTVTEIKITDRPLAYILGTNMIERNSLTRMAYKLRELVDFVIAEDDTLRESLTENEYATIVFKYGDTTVEIESIDTQEIIKQILEILPTIELIEPEKLKKIRNQLRIGHKTPWVLYFSSTGQDRLLLYQMRSAYPNMHFGEIECDKWGDLCASLQVETPPAFGILKPGGGYQLAGSFEDVRAFIPDAVTATNLHTLSTSDLRRILDDDEGTWILLIVPYKSSWDHISEAFTDTSIHYMDSENMTLKAIHTTIPQFGIITCTQKTDHYCRQLVEMDPGVVVHHKGVKHKYRLPTKLIREELVQFIDALVNNVYIELNEKEILEITDSSRKANWLVAFFPSSCDSVCHHLLHQWRIVAKKLRPLPELSVGVLKCERRAGGLCLNVRASTARLYRQYAPPGEHFNVGLQQLHQAPYMLEWALDNLNDSIEKFTWYTFRKNVAVEDLHPTSVKRPWLVYFHSPRCYKCYVLYPEFVIAGMLLKDAVNLGKVDCLNEQGICRQERIESYPTLKLYTYRNHRQTFSSVIPIQITEYTKLLEELKVHLNNYDENLLASQDMGIKSRAFHMKHDEF